MVTEARLEHRNPRRPNFGDRGFLSSYFLNCSLSEVLPFLARVTTQSCLSRCGYEKVIQVTLVMVVSHVSRENQVNYYSLTIPSEVNALVTQVMQVIMLT
jgi:hypothetical protein